MIFPHSLIKKENTLEGLKENDRHALDKLSEFLGSMAGYDDTTCLHNKHLDPIYVLLGVRKDFSCDGNGS